VNKRTFIIWLVLALLVIAASLILGPRTPTLTPGQGGRWPASLPGGPVNGTTVLDTDNIAGADIGAKVNAAIAQLGTILLGSTPYSAGKIIIPPKLGGGQYTQTTTVTINSPFLDIEGAGPGPVQINCTMNADCWNIHISPFTAAVGLRIQGITLLGTGSTNASAVGWHIGDVVGGIFSGLGAAEFAGTGSSCFWFDNIAGFTERNWFDKLDAGLAGNTQAGCTKDYRWTNSGGLITTDSFGHDHFMNLDFSTAGGQTSFSFDGGAVYDATLIATGNIISGSTGTVVAQSGVSYTAGPKTVVDGNLNITVECTSPCTAGTFLNIPSGFTMNKRLGWFYDSSGLLTNSIVGTLQEYIGEPSGLFDPAYLLYPTNVVSGTPVGLQINAPGASNVNYVLPTIAANQQFAFQNVGNYVNNGIQSNAFKSGTGSDAGSGLIQLANTDTECWRNAGGSADLCLGPNASNQLTFNSGILAGATGTPYLSRFTNTITTNVVMGTNSYTLVSGTFPAVTTAVAGTWQVQTSLDLETTSVTATETITCEIYDGTNVIAQGAWSTPTLATGTVQVNHMNVSGIVTEAAGVTFTARCTSGVASQVILAAAPANSGGNFSSNISAVRLGD
jgi:hypothetical protein